MTMGDRPELSDAALEALFDEARATPPALPEGLAARILADAEAALPPPEPAAARAPARGGWRGFLDALGGWPAFAGLSAATMAGLWIGLAAPDSLGTMATGVLGDGYDFTALAPDLAPALVEG